MISSLFASSRTTLALSLFVTLVGSASAQTAYGVNAAGNLFSFDLSAPASVGIIGNLGFTPEAIDFLPGSNNLYAINVTTTSAQLYTVNTSTGAASAVGSGFALSSSVGGKAYDLTEATSFGFDFNPSTLQGDNSIRIRFIGNNGTNLRLNNATGGIAAVDGAIAGTIGAAAYINNFAANSGGPTGLYDVDYAADTLSLQFPPNDGTLSPIGSLGIDVGPNTSFDIVTGSTGINSAYLVNGATAAVYTVNLTTGAATLVGTAGTDFAGGFAVAPIPEPAHFAAVLGLAMAGLAGCKRRRTPASQPNAA